MSRLSNGDKLKHSVWAVLTRVSFVVAVVVVALLPGISVAAGLVIVSAALILFTLAAIWLPTSRRPARRRRPPQQSSGDRYPRRPSPFRPSFGAERPLPSD